MTLFPDLEVAKVVLEHKQNHGPTTLQLAAAVVRLSEWLQFIAGQGSREAAEEAARDAALALRGVPSPEATVRRFSTTVTAVRWMVECGSCGNWFSSEQQHSCPPEPELAE